MSSLSIIVFMASTSILLMLTHSRSSLSPFKQTKLHRASWSHHICVIFGFLDDSTPFWPHMWIAMVKDKEIRIIPIIAEWERSMSFYGTVLDRLSWTMFSNDSGLSVWHKSMVKWIKDIPVSIHFKIYMDICNTTLHIANTSEHGSPSSPGNKLEGSVTRRRSFPFPISFSLTFTLTRTFAMHCSTQAYRTNHFLLIFSYFYLHLHCGLPRSPQLTLLTFFRTESGLIHCLFPFPVVPE